MPPAKKPLTLSDIQSFLAKGWVKWCLRTLGAGVLVACTWAWRDYMTQKAELVAVDIKVGRAVEKIDRVEKSQIRAEEKHDRFAERVDAKFDKLNDTIIRTYRPAYRPLTIDPHVASDTAFEGRDAQ